MKKTNLRIVTNESPVYPAFNIKTQEKSRIYIKCPIYLTVQNNETHRYAKIAAMYVRSKPVVLSSLYYLGLYALVYSLSN